MSPRPLSPRAIAVCLVAALAAGSAALGQVPTHEIVVDSPRPLQPHHELKHATIKYADLDLNSAAGADALARRIKGAAKQVCKPEPRHIRELKDQQDYKKCLDGASSHALASLGNPAVQQAWDRMN